MLKPQKNWAAILGVGQHSGLLAPIRTTNSGLCEPFGFGIQLSIAARSLLVTTPLHQLGNGKLVRSALRFQRRKLILQGQIRTSRFEPIYYLAEALRFPGFLIGPFARHLARLTRFIHFLKQPIALRLQAVPLGL
jgi:hypothetical protein